MYRFAGLEFDILFISTVRTNAANSTRQKNLGFLSDCKLLNTAITRARYRLVIIGDPLALCSLGDCQVWWRIILRKCNSNGTFHYRLPFETVVKMAKDTDERLGTDVNAQPVAYQQLPARDSSGIPFMYEPNAALPGRPPAFNGHNLPISVPRPLVPSGVPSSSLQQHPSINVPPPPWVNPAQGMDVQRPLNPFVLNHEMPSASLGNMLNNDVQPDALRNVTTTEQVASGDSPERKLINTQQETNGVSTEVPVPKREQEIGRKQGMEALASSGRTILTPNLNNGSHIVPQLDNEDQLDSHKDRPPQEISLDKSQKELLLLLESSLKCRQEMILKEQELLAMLTASCGSPGSPHLLENLQEQTSVSEKEEELLQFHIQQLGALQGCLAADESGKSDGFVDDLEASREDSLCPNSADDYIEIDTDEWFRAQQRDPIVQDYIKAFEKLSFKNDLMDENKFVNADIAAGNGPLDLFPVANQDLLVLPSDSLDIAPLKGWILQPSESTVYIETDSINEEHLEVANANAKIASGELFACRLQIDSFSDGNTATAKVCDPKIPDIRITSRVGINRAFHGDLVAVEMVEDNGKAPQGKVRAILKENHPRKVVCKLDSLDKNMMTPINRCNSKFVILQNKDHKGQTGVAVFDMKDDRISFKSFVTETEGKLFLVQLMKWGASYRFPLGFVVHYFPEGYDPQMSIAVLLAEHGLHKRHVIKLVTEDSRDFPPGWTIPLSERVRRKSYTKAFSVDPNSCIEVDDALSVTCEPDGTFKVAVHIADVSFFVSKNSSVDEAAFSQVSSVYGSTRVPYHNLMLPRYVGTELCSILPNKEKLAVSVVFSLNYEGIQIEEPEIHRSIVTSTCKLTYEQCQDVLDRKKVVNVPEHIRESIGILGQLSFKMWARRVRQGFISDDGEVANDALSSSKMIKEMMLQANHAVAKHLLQSHLAKRLVPLRCQLPPKVHNLSDIHGSCLNQGMRPEHFLSLRCLQDFSNDKGGYTGEDFVSVDLKTWEKASAALDEKDLGKLTLAVLHHENMAGAGKLLNRLASVQEHSTYAVSSTLAPETQGHFALNLPCYTHFTSPIRRYIDIVVHRILLAVLDKTEMPYTEEQVKNICEHCQMTSEHTDAFEKQLSTISRADTLRKDSKWRFAKVESLSPECLLLGGQEVSHIGSYHRTIRIHDCKPSSRKFHEEEEELVLSWNVLEVVVSEEDGGTKSRKNDEYASSTSSAQFDPPSGLARQFLKIPQEFWIEFLRSLRSEDFQQMNRQRQLIDAKAVVTLDKFRLSHDCHSSAEESIAMSSPALHQVLSARTKFYRKGDEIPVYLGAEMNRGLLRPTVLAVKFSDAVVCCMKHRRHPSASFGVGTLLATSANYASVKDYQNVMLPLLECEAVTASVNSDAAILLILKNVSIQWNGSKSFLFLSCAICSGMID